MRAMERRSKDALLRIHARGPAVERPRFAEEMTRLWLERPDKIREERVGEFPRVGVRVGDTWWMFNEHQGSMTNNGAPNHQAGMGQEFELMLEPAPLLPLFDFEIIAEEVQASRRAVRVRGYQRPLPESTPFLPPPLPHGCDDYEFVVDLANGMLLRVIGLIDGEPALDLQIVEVVFDEPIAPETFVFESPDGEPIEDVSQHRTLHPLPIETVAERASFTVFVATGLEEPWRMRAMHITPRRRQPLEQVHLSYHRSDAAHSFAINQQAAAAPDLFTTADEADEIEHDGVTMALVRPTERHPLGVVRLKREGTSIEITSDNLDIEKLLEIATSLRPISP